MTYAASTHPVPSITRAGRVGALAGRGVAGVGHLLGDLRVGVGKHLRSLPADRVRLRGR
jgi:hypothetical protein